MPRPPERRFFILFMGFWLPVLVYVTVVLVLGSQPYLQVPVHFSFSDKAAHIVEYLGLGLLMVRALRASLRVSRPLFAALMAIAFVVLIGSVDEWHQLYVPGRQGDLLDLAADSVGGGIAQVLYVLFARH